MKKLITILMAASILFAHGCSAKPETETTTSAETTTASVQQIETKQHEAIKTGTSEDTTAEDEKAESFKKAYLEVINNNYHEHKSIRNEHHYYTGILFAELFDWNLDGEPELMVGYATDEKLIYNIQYLDIYTMKDGKAELILSTDVYASYGALDGSQLIEFGYGKDGTLYLGIANEETDEMSYLGETYYTFKDGKIEHTRFWAELNYDNYELHDFKIDGKTVTEKQFNDKRDEIGAEEAFGVHVAYCEYDMLIDYLAGETKTYTNQLFSIYDDPEFNPSWVNGVDFGYKMKLSK